MPFASCSVLALLFATALSSPLLDRQLPGSCEAIRSECDVAPGANHAYCAAKGASCLISCRVELNNCAAGEYDEYTCAGSYRNCTGNVPHQS